MHYTNTVPRGLTIIIALMTMIGPFTIDTYLPSFPAIETEFNVSRALLSQSLSAYLVAFAFSTLLFGPLADRVGRRQVILFSLLFYVAASIGSALSSDYSSFLFYRLIQGAAAGGTLVAGRAMIRDVYSPQDAHRAMSRIMMLFAIAPAIAPIIGGWLQDLFGWQSIFYFLALFSLLVFLLVFFHVPETLKPTQQQSFHPVNIARVYSRTLVHHQFQLLIFIIAFSFGGMFLYIAGAPTVIFDFLNLSSHDFGMLFVPIVVGLIFGAGLSSRLAHKWPIERTIKLSIILMVLGASLNVSQSILIPPEIISSILPLVLYACGVGIAMPAMTVLSLDCFPKNRGTAAAVQSFIQMITNALIASLAIPLLSLQPSSLAIGQLAFLICALLLWWRLPKTIN